MVKKKTKKHTTYVYDLDKKVLHTIDDLAKEKNISRSAWIKQLLENFVALNDFKQYEDRYKSLIEKQGDIIQNNTNTLNKLLQMLGDDGK